MPLLFYNIFFFFHVTQSKRNLIHFKGTRSLPSLPVPPVSPLLNLLSFFPDFVRSSLLVRGHSTFFILFRVLQFVQSSSDSRWVGLPPYSVSLLALDTPCYRFFAFHRTQILLKTYLSFIILVYGEKGEGRYDSYRSLMNEGQLRSLEGIQSLLSFSVLPPLMRR